MKNIENTEQTAIAAIIELRYIKVALSRHFWQKTILAVKVTGTEGIYRLRCHQSVFYD